MLTSNQPPPPWACIHPGITRTTHHARARNFCKICTPRPAIPGVRVQHFLYPPGTSVSSVRPCHNTRNFCEFCNTSAPVPETSASSVILPYPYPESTNPTEHHLAILRLVGGSRVSNGIISGGWEHTVRSRSGACSCLYAFSYG